MGAHELDEMGPVDYLVVEWPDQRPTGEAAPLLMDLAQNGVIRVIDLAFITKGDDGTVAALDISTLADEADAFKELVGAQTELLSAEDFEEAGAALDPGTSAAILVYENLWAAPFASALRRSGAQVVANGRIPIQTLVAALDGADG
jgi:hypothetical protein